MINKESIYEILEHKLIITHMLVDKNLLGPEHSNDHHQPSTIHSNFKTSISKVSAINPHVTSVAEAIEMAQRKRELGNAGFKPLDR